jgi:hypothetical protein
MRVLNVGDLVLKSDPLVGSKDFKSHFEPVVAERPKK